MKKKRYLESGKIVNTHGIKGELKIYPWCDSPEFLLITGFIRRRLIFPVCPCTRAWDYGLEGISDKRRPALY